MVPNGHHALITTPVLTSKSKSLKTGAFTSTYKYPHPHIYSKTSGQTNRPAPPAIPRNKVRTITLGVRG